MSVRDPGVEDDVGVGRELSGSHEGAGAARACLELDVRHECERDAERLEAFAQRAAAGSLGPFDHGTFELVVEPIDAPEPTPPPRGDLVKIGRRPVA